MRILGVDPGLAITGWGVIEEDHGQVSLRACGHIATPARAKTALRLRTIYTELMTVTRTYHPQSMAIEELFFTKHTASIFSLGQARGVILLLAELEGLAITEYNPRSIKIALTGYGSADKRQIQEMVKMILKLPDIPKPDDTADAIAIALCHLNTGAFNRRLAHIR